VVNKGSVVATSWCKLKLIYITGSRIVALSSFSHPRPHLALVVAASVGYQPPSSVVVVVVVDIVLYVVVVALRHSQSLVLSILARYSDFRRPRSINKHQWASTSSTSDIPLLPTTRVVSRSTNAPVCFTLVTSSIPLRTVTDDPRRLPDGWNVQVPSCWGTGQG